MFSYDPWRRHMDLYHLFRQRLSMIINFGCPQEQDGLSSCRVCNGAHPSHSSTLHFCDVVFARYLPEMCAARHDMVQIACGCAAHTVFVLTVAPQTDVSLPGWQPVPSALGWPSAMYATAVCHHSGVVLLDGCHISSGCSG